MSDAGRQQAREAAWRLARNCPLPLSAPVSVHEGRAFDAGFNAGAEWQREQTPRYEVLAEQAERIAKLQAARIAKLESALTECRGALSELRQNARCSTDPAFVRAFDAATAVLAHTNAEALEARP